MFIKVTDFKSNKPLLVNTEHVACVKSYSEDPNQNGVPIIGSKAKPKLGSVIVFVLNGGQAIIKESLEEFDALAQRAAASGIY